MPRLFLAALVAASALLAGGCDADARRTDEAEANTVELDLGPPGPTVEVPGLDALAHRPLLRLDWGLAELIDIVVYEDGLVLVADDDARRQQFLSANIGPGAAAAMAKQVVAGGFFRLPHYGPNDCMISDLSSARLLVRDGARWHQSTYYGIGLDGVAACSGRSTVAPDRLGRDRPNEPPPPDKYSPPAFTRAYVRLANFKLTDPSPWQPEAIRIHIDDLDCASASPWPVGVRRPDGDAKVSDLIGHYCLVPGDQAAELHAFARGESRPGPSQPKGRGPFNAFDVYPAEEYLDKVVEALRRAAR
jgi:hypothetical protein